MYGRGQRDSWGIEYSCEDYGKDAEGSAGSTGRGAGCRVAAAGGRGYSRRWAEGIVGCRPIAVAYLCINKPVRRSWHLSEFTTALLHIFTHTNDFSFLLRRFTHLSRHLTDLLRCERCYYL